jgi:hypothetical protein
MPDARKTFLLALALRPVVCGAASLHLVLRRRYLQRRDASRSGVWRGDVRVVLPATG